MAEQYGVPIPTGVRDFSVFQNVQSGYRAQAASISMGTGVLSRSNMSRVSSVSLISIEGVAEPLPLSPPICLYSVEWDSVLPLLDSILLECPTRFASSLFQTFSLC
jgi:hypothetical protein